MGEKCYFISEASRLVGVEAHVLRYWEEQLDLTIRRNEMGHRYYIEEDIRLMQSVKQIMEKGIQLRAVKMLLPNLMEHREDTLLELMGGSSEQAATGRGALEGTQAEHLAEVCEKTAVAQAQCEKEVSETGGKGEMTIAGNEKQLQSRAFRMSQFQEIMNTIVGQALRVNNPELAAATSDQVSERVIKEMDYLMRVRESQEEERFKKLDETIRNMQKNSSKRRLGKNKK